ncbi:MAG: hypothetical protein HDR06_12155 [Lachnospiraceae bacterium]|nr:hypothetical protein [Lachnospiraceae bacterium]
MANYDTTIRVGTKIDRKGAEVQLMALENQIAKKADKIASLMSKMGEMKDAKLPTQEYQEITTQIEKAEQKLNKLLEKQEQMQREGKANGVAWDRLIHQIEETENEIKYAKGELQDLVDTGKAFTLGQDTEEYAKMAQQVQYLRNELSVLTEKHDLLTAKQRNATEAYKKFGENGRNAFKKINKYAEKSCGLLKNFGSRLKSLAISFFIVSQIGKAFRALTQGIKGGFDNFYKGNEQFRNSIDSLKASLLTLKNSLAAAFAPLVQMVVPYIQKAVEWLTRLIDTVGQFIAAISGQKTYKKAVKQTTAAIKEQNKEQNKQVSSLDKLNVITSDKDSGKDDEDTSGMFEEVPINSGILDFIQKLKDLLKPIIDYAEKLKDIFMQGFWDGLGDWEYRWQSIKDSLASIKESLIDIFTDPAVLAAADGWAQSVAYMLGSLVGAMASIGLTIATNILGGIAKYLEENKDRIKEHLISMFNIWAEINQMFAELFQSIAYVFEAFASEQGQKLTANIIGIFADTLMGITELASKFFRDIAQIIIKPFVDNKEAFRAALEGFLGVLAEVAGTIKQGIDDTFDKLNEVYDEHFKPFFDSVAQGLSDLVGQFLEFWNGNVQPILDQWAADFDELWQSHIQPLLDNAAEFLGKIADLLKVVWENYLQPMIAWIIANVLPKILPVIQAVWNTLKNLAGYIADMISGVITILGGLIDFVTGVLSGDWEKAFQGLQDIVSGFAETIRGTIEGGLQLISDILKVFVEATKSSIDAFLQSIKKTVEIVINFVKQNILGKFNEIKAGFSSFNSNVRQIWTNLWNGLRDKVKTILGSIKNTVKEALDWIAQKVGSIGDKFGSFGSKVGGLFGGTSQKSSRMSAPSAYTANAAIASLNKVEIPAYATGQVIPRTMKQHLAILGDNNRETEIVSPISTIKQALREEAATLGLTGGNAGQEINLHLTVECEGYRLLEIIQKLDREYYKQHGKHALA